MKFRVGEKYLRPATQIASLAVITFLFYNLRYPVSMPFSSPLLAADPLVGMAGVVFARGEWIPAVLPIAVFVVGTLVLGRVFCGWICPVGFLADVVGRLRGGSGRVRGRFGYTQYGVLTAVLIMSVFTINVLAIADPLVIFQRSIYVTADMVAVPVILMIIVGSSLVVARFWCRAICPAGGMLGIISLASPFCRNVDGRCNGCLKCRSECPAGAISKSNEWDATGCIKCLKCEEVCPNHAVSFSPSVPAMPAVHASRRAFLVGAVVFGALSVSRGVVSAITPDQVAVARPPGSLVEDKFNAACVRCGSCVRACLGKVITPAGMSAGLERMYTPALDFGRGFCQRCGTCGQVCPTGAIISQSEDKIKIGTAQVIQKLCVAWEHNTRCLVCNEVCPTHAIKGADRLRPSIDLDLCIGCGSCQYNCPVEGKAIMVSPAGERRRK